MGLVLVPVLEGGSKWAVDQTAGEDGLFRWAPFTPEEGSGDPPDRVHALFEIDREREEVDAFPWLLVRCGGNQHLGTTDLRYDGSVGLLGKLACTQDELFAAYLCADLCLGHVLLLLFAVEPRPLAVVASRTARV